MNLAKVYIIFLLCVLPLWSLNSQTVYQGSEPYCGEEGGLIINEVSNGPSGTDQEYIELLVVGRPDVPAGSVNLNGYIIDDNNIPVTGNGTTAGHIRLGSCYSSVPAGSIILIYNANDPNPNLPPDDPQDGNGDLVYVIPSNSGCLDNCSTEPSTSLSAYCPCTTTGNGSGYQALFDNAGDVIQLRDNCGTIQHAIRTGTVAPNPPVGTSPAYFTLTPGNQDDRVFFFDHSVDDNWMDPVNYLVGLVSLGAETPGVANNATNQSFIDDLRAGNLSCNGTIGNCTNTDAGLLDFPPDVTVNMFPIDLCEGQDIGAFFPIWTGSNYNEPDTTFFQYEYAFFLTDGSSPFNILAVNQSGDFDFSNLAPGDYYIWGISFYDPTGAVNVLGFLNDPCISTVNDVNNPSNCGYICDIQLDVTGNGPFGMSSLITITSGSSSPTDPMLQNICEDEAENYDLSALIPTINNGNGDPVVFFDGDPNNGGVEITNPSNTDLTQVSDLWIEYGSGNCAIAFDLQDPTILSSPTAFPLNDDPIICGVGGNQAFVDLTLYNDSINGGNGLTVIWYEDPALMMQIMDPTSYYITGNTFVYAVVDDGTCQSDSVQVFLNMLIPPNIITPQSLTACSGTPPYSFDLTSLHDDLWPVPGTIFNWYEDAAGTTPINNPSNYQSSGGTVYVAAGNQVCFSDTVPIPLNVGNSDFGDFFLACDAGGSTACYNEVICDNDGFDGETRCVYIDGATSNIDSVEIININSNVTDTSVFSSPSCINYFLPENDTSYFILTAVWANGEPCPDTSGLGDTLVRIVLLEPVISSFNPNPITLACDDNSVQLPSITGVNIPANVRFYTEAGGQGTAISPGSDWPINGDTTIYAFAGTDICTDEEILNIEVQDGPELDPVADFTSCNPVTMPTLSGNNLTGNGAFYPSLDFSGPGWAPGSDVDLSPPGNFTIYGVDGIPPCQDTISFVVTVLPEPSFTVEGDSVCSGELFLVDTLISPSNPGLTYTYHTSLPVGPGNEITGAVSYTSNTTLYVQGIDANGCTLTRNFPITVIDNSTPPNISNTGPYCEGEQLQLNFNGNGTGLTFNWTGPNGFSSNLEDPIIPNVTPANAGTYTLVVTENGCPSPTATTVVNIDVEPNAPSVTDPVIVCENSILQFQGTPPPAGQLNWLGPNGFSSVGSNPIVTNNSSPTDAGTYVVYGTAGNCIGDTTEFEVIVNPQPILTLSQEDAIICAGDSTASILVTVNNATNPINYDWSNDNYDGQDELLDIGAGFYELTITDNNNCSAASSITINEPNPISIICSGLQGESSPGASDGMGEVIINGGTPLYAIFYDNGNGNSGTISDVGTGSNIINNLEAGTYSVTITDDNNCTEECQFTINQAGCDLSIQSINQIDSILCNGESTASLEVTVSGGSGNYFYFWSNTNGDTLSITPSADALSAGVYQIEVVDSSNLNCRQVQNISIDEPDELIVDCAVLQNPSDSFSSDGVVEVNQFGGVPPYDINLTSDGDTINLTTPFNTVSVDTLEQGDYNITVMDQNDCQASCSFSLSPEICALDITLLSLNNIACHGDSSGSLSIEVNNSVGNVDINWLDPSLADNSSNLNNLPAGNYTVLVTDENCQDSTSFNITEPMPLLLEGCELIDSSSAPGYANGSALITLSGGSAPYVIRWAGSQNGTDTIVNDSLRLEDLSSGNYVITLADSNACVDSCSLNIPSRDCNIEIDLDSAWFSSCPSDSSLNIAIEFLSRTTNTILQWSHDSLLRDSMATNLAAGNYEITALDTISGCSDTLFVEKEFADTFSIACFVNQNPSSSTADDGSIGLFIGDGQPPFSISLTGPNLDTTFSTLNVDSVLILEDDLGAGMYTFTVTDSFGCEQNCSSQLNPPECDSFSVSITQTQEILCHDETTAALSTSVSEGSGNYIIDWNIDQYDGQLNISGLGVGNYTVQVLDSSLNCSDTAQLSIEQPEPLLINCNQLSPASDSSASDGRAEVVVSGGIGPYWLSSAIIPNDSILIDSSSNRQVLNNLPSGNYTLVVSDNNGCIDSCVLIIEFDASACNIQLDASFDNLLCSGDSSFIDLMVNNAEPPVNFDWERDQFDGLQTFYTTTAGSYSVIVSDNRGCTDSLTFTIDSLSTERGFIDTTICSGSTLEIGNTIFSESNTDGIVRLQGQAQNGCDSIIEVMVRFQEVSINYDIIDPECPNQLNSILQIIDIEGQIPFEVYLNNNPVGSFSQTAFVFDNLSAGNYEFVAIDGNTCSDTINFIIENIDLPNVQIQDISPIQEGDSVGLSADFSGDAEIIQWMPSATLSCDTCLATLAYPTVTQLFSISIIDSQNCIVNDSILVEVVEEKANVYIPNVFSPNGDGINDYFTAYSSSENSSIKEMLIFDRWGELLVERRNIPLNSEIMGWDGNVGNESMDNGVYVYSILIIEDDGTERRYAGDVTLVR